MSQLAKTAKARFRKGDARSSGLFGEPGFDRVGDAHAVLGGEPEGFQPEISAVSRPETRDVGQHQLDLPAPSMHRDGRQHLHGDAAHAERRQVGVTFLGRLRSDSHSRSAHHGGPTGVKPYVSGLRLATSSLCRSTIGRP